MDSYTYSIENFPGFLSSFHVRREISEAEINKLMIYSASPIAIISSATQSTASA